jgi:hypothetical protein
MTANNWVATIAAIAGFLTALLNFLRQRQGDRTMRTTAYYSKSRFDDVLSENRRLREKLVKNHIPVEDRDDAGNS